MPFYYDIDNTKPEERRIAAKLLALKEGLAKAKIPTRSVEGTLLLATWNIREFGDSKYGVRGKEPIYYMAEIISRFDLVAVQEIRRDLKPLNTLLKILGSWWKVIMTDITIGRSGNNERLAFLYDSRKISFGGLAGEIVIPPEVGSKPSEQLARTPFMVGFQAGWFKFTICVTHIYYGKSVPIDERRLNEITNLANFLRDRTEEEYAWSSNMIMLGDFNIFNRKDVTFEAIKKAGFAIPQKLDRIPGSNALMNKHYDQIAIISPEIQKQLELCEAGVFDFFEYVYRTDEEQIYLADLDLTHDAKKDSVGDEDKKGKLTDYKMWRTFQMSDHLPMWVELKVDFGIEYLNKKTNP